ncbi:CotH kinase family protein [Pseudoalteromonas sp. MMG012]|uniref:CotH kinase family protein n=1 Tax=Pseudoalteromonas sp. MMG012 TaxID=2822686 RepID=UPI001B3A70C9|nr:CotH kinase family protein [Pseudoalteromonas sp. MMG012]MBQ4849907.1 CotH kinase family protein [Pseudoalteromonas sp. MMG012]
MRLDSTHARTSKAEKLALIGALCVIVILLLPSVNMVKTLLIQSGFVSLHQDSKEKAMQLVSDVVRAPLNWAMADSDHPLLKIDIKYQDWLLLEKDRDTAFTHGQIPEQRSEVAGSVFFENKKLKATIRLQGDMLDHVAAYNRWSLRVELKQKQALFSARRFSLLSSNVRIHQGPMLFSETLKLAGFDIITPTYRPVKVVINGQNWGVMMFEQAFSQDMLATNNRTEGMIVRLDLHQQTASENLQLQRILKPRVIQRNTVLKNASLSKQRQIALALLSDFLDGRRTASDVFDVKRLGQYLATVDVWGAWHALTWNNWRWYYNPHTAKLEPIQSDVAVTPAEHHWLMQPPSNDFLISKQMLADPRVKHAYNQALQTLKQQFSRGELLAKLSQRQQHFMQRIHTSAPLVNTFNLALLEKQLHCIENGYLDEPCQNIQPMDSALHQHMTSMVAQRSWDLVSGFTKSSGISEVTIRNPDSQSLEIKGISGVNKFDLQFPLENINAQLPVMLTAGSELTFSLPQELTQVEVTAGLSGKKKARFTFIENIQPLSFIPRPTQHLNLKKYPFIEVAEGHWKIKTGHWTIDDYIVSTDDIDLVIDAGTHLTFTEGSGLMIFGGVMLKGELEAPIVITRAENASYWAGISVFNKNSRLGSSITHTQLSHASSPKLGLWQPRGSAYFIGGKVNIDGLKISDNYSEDALNIINGDVTISRLSIRNALSDAFDCDFCTGSVSNSAFNDVGARSGGDGIDVSGSNLKISGTHFTNIRDKAISAGERSKLAVYDSQFSRVNFALVAKDDSTIVGSKLTVMNVNHYALMSYSKKPYFGPAKMDISEFTCKDVGCGQKMVSQIGSMLSVNDKQITPQPLSVKGLYQTVMKSDKPK